MNSEEEFDRLIRKKAEGAEYSFNEADWEKAANMLDESRKRSLLDWKPQYMAIAAAVVITFGTALFYLVSDSNKPDQELTTVSINAPVNPQSRLQAGNQSSSEGAHEQNSNTKHAANAGQHSSELTSQTSQQIAKPTIVQEVATAKTDLAGTKDPVSEKQPDQIAKSDVSGEIPEQANPSQEKIAESKEKEPVKENDPIAEAQPQIVPQMASAAADAEATEMVYLDAFMQAAPQSEMEANSNLNFQQDNDQDYYRKHPARRHQWMMVEAGALYSMGWSSASGQDGKGTNWFGGVLYGKYFGSHFSAASGIQAFSLAHMKDAFYQYTETHFDFYRRETVNDVTAVKMYGITVPLQVQYRFNRHHTAGLNAFASYMVWGENEIVSTPENASENAVVKTTTQGVYNGVAPVIIGIGAHYRYAFNKKWSVNTQVSMQITDMFKNNDFNNYKQSPLTVRVGLGYSIFDK